MHAFNLYEYSRHSATCALCSAYDCKTEKLFIPAWPSIDICESGRVFDTLSDGEVLPAITGIGEYKFSECHCRLCQFRQ